MDDQLYRGMQVVLLVLRVVMGSLWGTGGGGGGGLVTRSTDLKYLRGSYRFLGG